VYTDGNGREHAVTTPQDWAKRRKQILGGMQEAMGPLPDRSHLPALDVKVSEEVKGDAFVRQTISFVAEGTERVPAHLYLPVASAKGRRLPAVLALHQTSERGKADLGGAGKPNMGYAPELARRGYIVLCPDYPSFGDLAGYDFAKDDYVSGSMKGVFNHMRCVDLLESRDDVDGERIGVIGHSLGGHNAMFVGVFDERIKAIVSSCGWTPFADYYGGKIAGWTSDRYMPLLRDKYHLDPKQVPFDFYEVVVALAPRAFFSSSPLHDDNFAVEGVRKAEAAARPVFELLGAADKLKVIYPDCTHDFPPEVRREAFAFMDKVLANAPAESAQELEDYGPQLPRIPPHEPKDALSTFQTLPGFHMEQVAAEPLVCSPVACSFDENGRLFVIEMRDYSEQDKERLGRVRMLEDTDGDGVFDKSTIYAEDLSWPTAIICYGGGVFVGAPPDVYYLKDADGDGKADQRKLVFTGFERGNVQGLMNSFNWSLDNRIHGATSLSGAHVRRPDDPNGKVIDLGGRDFSFDPRTLDLRPESGGAQHGLSFDDWGRRFVCSNSDHIQAVMFEDRYLERNPYVTAPPPRLSIAADGPQAKVFRISPVEPWRVLRTRLRVAGVVPGPIEGGGQPAGYFSGATGTTIYRGNAWPVEYRGQAFIGDVGSNLVHRKVIEPEGVGFVARRVDDGKEFVASSDIWFRPVQFANAPDGTLYVLDMYREVIEHPASLPPAIKKHLDLTSGRDRGRIYRIVPDGFQQHERPNLGTMTTGQLVATLEHRNGWHRDTAARLLYERQDPAAKTPLEKLAATSKLPEARVHATYALAGMKALTPQVVRRALDDDHPRVREHAMRLAETVPHESFERELIQTARDPDPRVRYQAAFTLATVSSSQKNAALTRLLNESGGDPWTRFAALTSLTSGAGEILPALTPEALNHVAEPLCAQAAAGGDAAELRRVLQALPANDGPLRKAMLRGLSRGLAGGGGRSLREVVAKGSAEERKLADILAAARRTAADPNAAPPARAEAARLLALGSFEDGREVLTGLLSGRHPQEVQLAAISALDRFTEPEVGAALVRSWPTFTPRLRIAAADAIFSRARRAALFLDAVDAGKIPPSDVDASRLRALESSEDPALAARAQKMIASLKRGRREDVVAAYLGALELKGDSAKGKVTFQKTCAACHRLEGLGHEIGPNLAAMQNRGAEAILVNVLDPNREVNPQFLDYIVTTTDGRTLTGMLAAETANSVTLRRAEGASDTVLRTNIKQMRSSRVSIMPEALEQQIDPQGMADLIAYIMSAK
jgi:putative membrane-bound dehydrogenase-like protein